MSRVTGKLNIQALVVPFHIALGLGSNRSWLLFGEGSGFRALRPGVARIIRLETVFLGLFSFMAFMLGQSKSHAQDPYR